VAFNPNGNGNGNRGRGRFQGGGMLSEINVTPFVDVLLVLLIIFMAIAPVPQGGLSAAIPQESPDRAAAKPENPVVLEIAGDGSYWLNSRMLAPGSLQNRLGDVFERRGDRTLFVKGADSLEYSVVAAAIDIAHGAGIDRVALMPR
jgi:biopolymer transport protein TolR